MWTAPDSGAIESGMIKLWSDPEYVKLTEGAAPYFLPGTIYDEWWRTPTAERARSRP